MTFLEGTTAADAVVKFEMPASNLTVTAGFAKKVGTVRFNANGGFGSMDSVPADEGTYTLPECTIMSPGGKLFKGWATDAEGDNMVTAVTVTDGATTDVYAIWEENPNGYKVYGQWVTMNSVAELDALIADIKAQNADIVGIESLKIPAAGYDYTYLLDALDYPYYEYIADTAGNAAIRGNLILSKYPVTLQDGKKLGNNCTFSYLTTTIDGKALDLFIGYDTASYCESFVQVKTNANSGDFVIFGHSFNSEPATWAGRPVVYSSTGTNKVVVSGVKLQVTGTQVVARNAAITSSGNLDIMTASFKFKKVVTFNANGGSGTMNPAYAATGSSYTLPACTFTGANGQAFAGWSLAENGAVISTDTITVNADTVLYAQWKDAAAVTVTDGTGSGEYAAGTTVTLTANAAPSGKVFSHWEGLDGLTITEGNVVSTTVKFTMPASDLTVKAVYRDIGSFKALNWWVGQMNTATEVETIVAAVKEQSPDVAVLLNVAEVTGAVDMEEIAKTLGYPYSRVCAYSETEGVAKGYLIVSRFPLTFKENKDGTQNGTKVFYLTTEVDGYGLDLYVGHDWRLTGSSADSTVNYENWIEANAETSGNDFIIFGHFCNSYPTEFAGKTVDYINSGTIFLMTSKDGLTVSDKMMVTKPASLTDGGINQILTMDLKVSAPAVTLDANDGTGTETSTYVKDGSYTLPECTFTAPTGKYFAGWAETANGSVITDTSITVTEDTTLYAVWNPLPTLKLASASTYAYGGGTKVSSNLTAITEAMKTYDADVITLMGVHRGPNKKTTEDQYTLIKTAMAQDYPHAYFAPVWDTFLNEGQTADLETGEGCMGHMILSKYPIIFEEAIYLSTDTDTTAEKRGVGHVILNVKGVAVDVFFGHMKSNANWKNEDLKASIAAANDAWIVTGNIFGSYDIATELGETVNKAYTGSHSVVVSGILSFANVADQTEGFDTANVTNPGVVSNVTVTLPAPKTVKFSANGGTGTMTRVMAYGTYTLPECTFDAPEGKYFAGWAETASGAVITDTSITVTEDTTLYAVWKDVVNSLKVAALPANRFQNNYTANADAIKAYLQSLDVDVLMISGLDNNISGYGNNSDVVDDLIRALYNDGNGEYVDYYFAKAWNYKNGGSETTNDGWFGHLIFTKYPIVGTPTTIVQAASDAEGITEARGAGYVTLDLGNGHRTVDVFFMHNGAVGNLSALADYISDSSADAWLLLGDTKITAGNKTTAETNLGATVYVAENGYDSKTNNAYIAGSSNLTMVVTQIADHANSNDTANYWSYYQWHTATVTFN